MPKSDLLWSLYDEIRGRQIDGLTLTQLNGVLGLLNESDRAECLIWHEGLSDWKTIPDFPELVEGLSGERATPKPAQLPPSADLRMTRRFQIDFVATVSHPDGIFMTRTINISLGGVLLADPPPDKLPLRFQITLSRDDGETIRLQCMRVPVPGGGKTRRLKFIHFDDDSALRRWLLDAKGK